MRTIRQYEVAEWNYIKEFVKTLIVVRNLWEHEINDIADLSAGSDKGRLNPKKFLQSMRLQKKQKKTALATESM